MITRRTLFGWAAGLFVAGPIAAYSAVKKKPKVIAHPLFVNKNDWVYSPDYLVVHPSRLEEVEKIIANS